MDEEHTQQHESTRAALWSTFWMEVCYCPQGMGCLWKIFWDWARLIIACLKDKPNMKKERDQGGLGGTGVVFLHYVEIHKNICRNT